MLQNMLTQQEKSSGESFGPSLADYTSTIQDLQKKFNGEKRKNQELTDKYQKLEAQIERTPLLENKLRSLQADLKEKDGLIQDQKKKIQELEDLLEGKEVETTTPTTSVPSKTSGGKSRYIPL